MTDGYEAKVVYPRTDSFYPDPLVDGHELLSLYIDHPTMQTLELARVDIVADCLHLVPRIEINLLDIPPYGEASYDEILTVLNGFIQEWVDGERNIDAYFFGEILPRNHSTVELIRALVAGKEGSFENPNIEERIKLIKRNNDGTGLLILGDSSSILLISCDYAFRRKRRFFWGQKKLCDGVSEYFQRFRQGEVERYKAEFNELQEENKFWTDPNGASRRFANIRKTLIKNIEEYLKSIKGIPKRE